MSLAHLQRAVYHLTVGGGEVTRPADPAAALSELRAASRSQSIAHLPGFDLRLDLDADEARMIEQGDVAGLYRAGVHPNLVRNFAGTFAIDYVTRYREAGL